MIIIKIALRTLLKRKKRMILIGLLVFFGTFLLIFGASFTNSSKVYSRLSIINNFTGDFVLYSDKYRDNPNPFTFTTPLPNIQDIDTIIEYLQKNENIESFVPIAQNYSLISVERDGKKYDLPFIYYAVEPQRFLSTFKNVTMEKGDFFGIKDVEKVDSNSNKKTLEGIVLSKYQYTEIKKTYNIDLAPGDKITLLGISNGGGVNSISTTIHGIYSPKYYSNVFNYISFMDMQSYSTLYNFTGIKEGFLPDDYSKFLNSTNDEDIFAFSDKDSLPSLDLSNLETEKLSGYTMIAVKLKNHDNTMIKQSLLSEGFKIKIADWDTASGFLASISKSLQIIIYIASGLIFFIVALILMNTLIINIIERTAEIGTIRAIGTSKMFVAKLFLTETLVLNMFFALCAIVFSFIVLLIFKSNGYPLPEIISLYLIGGGNLPVIISFIPFIQSIIIILAVSVLATLYPISVASSITPLKAMLEKQ